MANVYESKVNHRWFVRQRWVDQRASRRPVDRCARRYSPEPLKANKQLQIRPCSPQQPSASEPISRKFKIKPRWNEAAGSLQTRVRPCKSPSPGDLSAFESFMFHTQSSSHHFDVPWNSSPVKPVHPAGFTGQVLPSGVNNGFTSGKWLSVISKIAAVDIKDGPAGSHLCS